MDVIAKNMKITTTDTLLNYGSLSEGIYVLIGNVKSISPFTLTLLADGNAVPFPYDVIEDDGYTIIFSTIYSTFLQIGNTERFKLQFDTDVEKTINLKLMTAYPISPLLPNEPTV
jgi:hypothetical protein